MMATERKVDIPTVAGIAALIYIVSVLIHEAGGHGGACLALGQHPVAWSAYYFDCDTHAAPAWKYRVVAAAGSTVNLVAALISAVWIKTRLARPAQLGLGTVALWLFFMVNALTWSGYFLFSGVAGIGDWGTQPQSVLSDISHPYLARLAMAVIGGGLYYLCIRIGARWLARIVGGARRDLARRIAFTAYVTGGVTALLIGLLNPIGVFIVLASAAASTLGGTVGLFSTVQFMPAQPAETDFTLPRNWFWIFAGIIGAAAYGAVLGPTIQLG